MVGDRLCPRRRQPLAGDTGEHTSDVRLDEAVVALEGEDTDRTGRVATDPGQRQQVVEARRHTAAVELDHRRRRIMKVACSTGVTETLPQPQDVAE